MVEIRIEYENEKALTLMHIYLGQHNENELDTISGLRANLFFDADYNWLGIEVFNDFFEEEKIDLPILIKPYVACGYESVQVTTEKIEIWFDSAKRGTLAKEVECNIDYGREDGLQSIELILFGFEGKMDIANRFIEKH